MAALSIMWMLGSVFPFIFQCTPVRRGFDPFKTGPGSCHPMKRWLIATAYANVIMDWIILLLPIIPLFRIRSRMDKTKKGLVFAAFALGSLACITTSARAWINSWGEDMVSSRLTDNYAERHKLTSLQSMFS